MLAIFAYCSSGVAIYPEPKFGDKTNRAKHTQCIFVKTLGWVADSPHYHVLYVLLTVVRID